MKMTFVCVISWHNDTWIHRPYFEPDMDDSFIVDTKLTENIRLTLDQKFDLARTHFLVNIVCGGMGVFFGDILMLRYFFTYAYNSCDCEMILILCSKITDLFSNVKYLVRNQQSYVLVRLCIQCAKNDSWSDLLTHHPFRVLTLHHTICRFHVSKTILNGSSIHTLCKFM